VTLPPVGTRMVRPDDGRRGAVEFVTFEAGSNATTEPRVVYYDRGERVIAPKREHWEPDELGKRLPLRAEEKLEVALHADRALRAIDQHEPLKFWERPALSAEPYDANLVLAIIAYLSTRE
jgi:hypothetical protein